MKSPIFLLALLVIPCATYAIGIDVGPGQAYPDLNTAAHARAVHAGDTVYLHAGTYGTSPYFIDSLIGRPDAWIVIRPYRQDSVSIHVAWLLQTVQYVHFTGLHFFGNDPSHASEVYHLMQFDYAYDCYTRNHDIAIDRCTFTDLNNTGKQASGAFLKFTGCDNFMVDSCTFKNGTNVADGISMNGNRNGVIRRCRFENISGYGSHTKGGTKNILYERNLFVHCDAAGLDVGGDTGPQFFCPLGAPWECDSIKVYSNIFVGGRVAIQLSSAHHAFIVNNTCFAQTTFAFRLLNASSNHVYVDSNFIANNIFTTTGSIYLNASANYQYATTTFRNNDFFTYSTNVPSTLNWSEMSGVVESRNSIIDPDFTDTAAGNFQPRASALFDAGMPVPEPTEDYYGNAFPIQSRGVGAVSIPSAARVVSLLDSTGVAFSPNPATTVLDVRVAAGIPDAPTIILNSIGETVLTADARSIRIDLSRIPSGVYFVHHGDAIRRLVIAR